MKRSIRIFNESWGLARPFAISRGVKTMADVVIVEIKQGRIRGRAECVPYPRYGESIDSVTKQITKFSKAIEDGMTKNELQSALGPGAARNALDCALWDLESKIQETPVWEMAGLRRPQAVLTAETISIDSPEAMGARARALSNVPLIKIKLDTEKVVERLTSIRDNAPNVRLIVDANESWTLADLRSYLETAKRLAIEMVEQPIHAKSDQKLSSLHSPIAICADESCHDRNDLKSLLGKYSMINIKLDKTGGLTEALALKKEAESLGLKIMVGCMLGTSLAMAPALLLAQEVSIVDLDGPLLLQKDREPSLNFDRHQIMPPASELWG